MTSPDTRPIRRLTVGALTIGAAIGAVVVTRAATRRRALFAPIVEDLRSPILYVPASFRTGRLLPLLRQSPPATAGIRPGVDVRSETIDGFGEDCAKVRVVVYEGSDRTGPSPALVWIHGGGYIIGAPEQANAQCSRWADELGVTVVSVDYRLAPEHPFPAALHDCYAALRWVHDQADALGVDSDRVAVGGDSAGGGLAAALAQFARDQGGSPVSFQLLEYPMLDDRTTLRDDFGGTGHFIWTPTSNRFGWTAYLGHEPNPNEAPRFAAPGRTTDLDGLPPAWIGVGDLDLFLDEDVAYADALRDAGVSCELDIVPGMYHGADSILAGRPTSRAFRDTMTNALAKGLGVTVTTSMQVGASPG